MGLGDAWAEGISGSVAKLNGMTVPYGTGDYLASLDKTKHKLVVCTSTAAGLTANHVYLASADGTTWIDITQALAHTHSSSSDGGTLGNILSTNHEVIDLLLTKTTDLYEANWASPVYWIKTVTGTGSVENKTDGTTGERSIRLRPNGTSGSGSTIQYPHLQLDFSKPSAFSTKLQIETASSIALHVGPNADDVTAADSNTVKYNAEVCTATNNNWFLRTASGSANSTSDSGTAMSTNKVGITIRHRPDLGTPEVDLYIDTADVFQKTSNIPITSNTASNNLVKASVKNSTAADRPLLFYGARISYTVKDNWVA